MKIKGKFYFAIATISVAGYFISIFPTFHASKLFFINTHKATEREVAIIKDVYEWLSFEIRIALWFIIFLYALFALALFADRNKKK